MGFSRDSRFRLLSLFATLDWSKVKPALFITLTYPDSVGDFTSKKLNLHRGLFIRDAEKHLGKQVSVIWRIEWKDRKSGINKGKFYPHYHLMMFNVKWFDKDDVNSLWKKTIGVKEYVRTDTQRMANEKQTGYYIAKYCAKTDDSSLVNAAYLSSIPNGRQWGVLRKQLLHLHDEESLRIEASHMQETRELCEKLYPRLKGHKGSFTLLGKNSEIVSKEIFGK